MSGQGGGKGAPKSAGKHKNATARHFSGPHTRNIARRILRAVRAGLPVAAAIAGRDEHERHCRACQLVNLEREAGRTKLDAAHDVAVKRRAERTR